MGFDPLVPKNWERLTADQLSATMVININSFVSLWLISFPSFFFRGEDPQLGLDPFEEH